MTDVLQGGKGGRTLAHAGNGSKTWEQANRRRSKKQNSFPRSPARRNLKEVRRGKEKTCRFREAVGSPSSLSFQPRRHPSSSSLNRSFRQELLQCAFHLNMSKHLPHVVSSACVAQCRSLDCRESIVAWLTVVRRASDLPWG